MQSCGEDASDAVANYVKLGRRSTRQTYGGGGDRGIYIAPCNIVPLQYLLSCSLVPLSLLTIWLH